MTHAYDRVPDGYRRSGSAKGLLRPTMNTLRQQQIAVENRELKAAITELQEQMALVLAGSKKPRKQEKD